MNTAELTEAQLAPEVVTQQQALQEALAPRVRERLEHLFRGTLREGCIHPLYLPVLRFRHAQAGRE